MSSGYAILCLSGPMEGRWYTRRGVVLRFTKVRAGRIVGQLNSHGDSVWLATKYRREMRRQGNPA